MGLLIVICLSLPILALAAQRNDLKRMALIALGLEPVKYLLFLIVIAINNEFLNIIFAFVFFLGMLPEMLIGGEFGPSTIWQWIEILCVGVVWNLAPAYYISLLLPDIPQIDPSRLLKKPERHKDTKEHKGLNSWNH